MLLPGCAQLSSVYSATQIEHADRIAMMPDDATQLPGLSYSLSTTQNYNADQRNQFVEIWMTRSDQLCREFKDKIIAVARGERTATDITSGLLAGLATIFTQIGTVRPLAGAAAIVTGAGSALSADTFAAQTGDVLASAIETARQNQANQIEANLKVDYASYNIYRAERDVQAYHDLCSLESALNQVRSSLKATSPDAGTTPQAAQGNQAQTTAVAPANAPQPAPPNPGGTTAPPIGAPAPGASIGAADYLQNYMNPPGATPAVINQRIKDVALQETKLGMNPQSPSQMPASLPFKGTPEQIKGVARKLGWAGK
jgi:hypothetical protein